jgi:hypothetical protein
VALLGAVRRTQAVIDALGCVAVFAIARVLMPTSYVAALVAALLAALCPYTIFYTRALLKEPIATALLTWTMLFVVETVRDRRIAPGDAAGASAALAGLCTTQLAPLGPLSRRPSSPCIAGERGVPRRRCSRRGSP